MENKITSGIWLIFIGLVLLLHNLDFINFNLWATFKYWPLLVVIAGINLMVQNKAYGGYIKMGVNVLFLGWILYVGVSEKNADWTDFTVVRDKAFGTTDEPLANDVRTPYDNSMGEAILAFNGGGGTFEMNVASTGQLVSATSADNSIGMDIRTSKQGTIPEVFINARPAPGQKTKKASLTLHPDVVWDLDFNFGAANIEGDLSGLKFKHLELNTGASTVNLTLGTPQAGTSTMDISTGASTIHLRIPKDAAIEVEHTSVLSKNTFEGLDTKKKGLARSTNYEDASDRFRIKLEGAANTFKISRY